MISITPLRAFMIGVALLLAACDERDAAQSEAARPRSRVVEYRAGLDAYVAGRRTQALEHFRAAAQLGNVNAQYYTGQMYANGEGTRQDYREAAKWYQKAAERNQPDALFQLARLHAMGLGVKMDVNRAMELFDRTARALPPGEKRDQAIQQRDALAALANPPS